MQVIKYYSHKQGYELLKRDKQALLPEIEAAIQAINAIDCLTKISNEKTKQAKWAGLLFSPRTINHYFRTELLYPSGWVAWDPQRQKYVEPALYFPGAGMIGRTDRYRKMDGIKDRVGLEIQMGKYAFMGYDIFSKMIIFKNKGLIDYGIEITPVQEMIDCMSTGVSAFEHLMIDFEHRGEADIDIPVLILGIGPTQSEWDDVRELQRLYRQNPADLRLKYPGIGSNDLKGSKPGPK